jgi:hypothetical protein
MALLPCLNTRARATDGKEDGNNSPEKEYQQHKYQQAQEAVHPAGPADFFGTHGVFLLGVSQVAPLLPHQHTTVPWTYVLNVLASVMIGVLLAENLVL